MNALVINIDNYYVQMTKVANTKIWDMNCSSLDEGLEAEEWITK